MQIKYNNSFLKDIQKGLPNNIKDQVKDTINTIKISKDIYKIKNTKKLKWFLNNYRIRIWDYRIGFHIEKNTIIFDRCLHRKDIYKKYP